MIFFRKVFSLFLTLVFLVMNYTSGLLIGGEKLIINEEHEYQTMVSWGTSSAWWSQQMSDCSVADEIAKLMYDKDCGLGLDVYRFNIGAGEKKNPDSIIPDNNLKTESFYYYNETEGKYIYDFTRDANAVMMMDKAIAAGAESIIMFCNSPHFSMTVSGKASGGTAAPYSNLPKENYQAFVDYVLTIADHFVEAGYPVKYISPINEPQWNWGEGWVSQEGCHYEPEEAVNLLELFAVNMQQRNTKYGLLGIESGELSKKYYDYIDLFSKSDILMSYCDTYCAHSYWIDNNIEQKIKAGTRVKTLMPDKIFEMSEWCELPCKLDAKSIDSAIYMANIIAEDLRYLGVNSWSTWTACDIVNDCHNITYSDRLFTVEPDMSDFAFMKRYYALKHFSSFIPAGSIRIETKESRNLKDILSVGYKRPDGQIVLVLVNNSNNNYNISLGKYVVKEMYITDKDVNCESRDSKDLTNIAPIESKSIATLLLSSNK